MVMILIHQEIKSNNLNQQERNNKQIFINCPFDNEYRELLRPLLFTIIFLGYSPRIASESLNSGENRIDKICNLINITAYSIHDISRCKSLKENEYFRMNMPFELGIDFGKYKFTNPERRILILEEHRFDYQKSISDLAGVDIKCHEGIPVNVVKCVRNWTIEAKILKVPSSPIKIWNRFTDFTLDFCEKRKEDGFSGDDLNDMPTPEYINAIEEWVTNNK